jgi:hypothetical protein
MSDDREEIQYFNAPRKISESLFIDQSKMDEEWKEYRLPISSLDAMELMESCDRLLSDTTLPLIRIITEGLCVPVFKRALDSAQDALDEYVSQVRAQLNVSDRSKKIHELMMAMAASAFLRVRHPPEQILRISPEISDQDVVLIQSLFWKVTTSILTKTWFRAASDTGPHIALVSSS